MSHRESVRVTKLSIVLVILHHNSFSFNVKLGAFVCIDMKKHYYSPGVHITLRDGFTYNLNVQNCKPRKCYDYCKILFKNN